MPIVRGAKLTEIPEQQIDEAAGVPPGQPKPSFLARLRYALTGKEPAGWFGPGTPIPPVAQEAAHGRRFDYPFAVNMSWIPRAEQGENAIDFVTLRRMADPALGGLDLIRLAIETRKDQMATQKWHIRAREEKGDGGPRAREIERLLRKPDMVQPFKQWQRSVMEDALVLDAPTIYLRPSPDFGRAIPEIMDGATIKRLLDPSGRVPLPPEPAYRQVLKGVPATDYTLEEMIYFPRNPRPNRIYGMSPVEQVIGIVSIALRRQLHVLNYFTDGNVPDAFVGVPENWTQDQIESFQRAWDAILSGNLAERRGAKFVPGGTTVTFTRDPELKGEIEDWLSRVISYCFGLSPQALVREMNRATAETDKEAAAEEGLEPWRLWFKDLMDEVVERAFGAPDLEWSWDDEEIQDALTKAQVTKILVKDAGVITEDEARVEMYGREPFTAEQKAERVANAMAAAQAAFGGAPGKQGGGEEDEGEAGAAPGKQEPPPKKNGEDESAAAKKLAALVAEELKKKSFTSRRSTGKP